MQNQLIAAAAGVLLLGGLASVPLQSVAAADGVEPKKGEWRDGVKAVDFDVVGNKPRKIKSPTVGDEPCPGVLWVSYNGRVKIKRTGKFKYEGPGTMYLPGADPYSFEKVPTEVTFKGEFKSKTKAKGRFVVKDCIDTRFTAVFYP